jgi:hypothetical protein
MYSLHLAFDFAPFFITGTTIIALDGNRRAFQIAYLMVTFSNRRILSGYSV